MSSPLVIGGFLLAAAIGGMARFSLGQFGRGNFPFGTLVANTAASVLLGWIASTGETSHLVIGTGFAGALSTWSTFAYELVDLARTDRHQTAWWYFAVTVVAGVGGALVGLHLA